MATAVTSAQTSAFPSQSIASSSPATSSAPSTSSISVTPRRWSARGHADHGWLHTFHTFSFASYYSRPHSSFGPLRVINEDRVAPGRGFGRHSHAEFLIWSYVVSGALEHKDSMGNVEKLERGEVQFTSAGTGIAHSEHNASNKEEVHFLQIWAKPNVSGLTPSYVTRKWTDEQKRDQLVRIVDSLQRGDRSPSTKEGVEQPIPLHADLSMSASILTPGKKVTHDLVADGERKVYVHVVMTARAQPEHGGAKIKVGDVVLGEGDGAYVTGARGPGRIEFESVGDKNAEFLVFDMAVDEVGVF